MLTIIFVDNGDVNRHFVVRWFVNMDDMFIDESGAMEADVD